MSQYNDIFTFYNDKFQISVNCILIQASTYILEGLSITNWQSFATHAAHSLSNEPGTVNNNIPTACINFKLLQVLKLIRDLGTSDHTPPLYHYLISWAFILIGIVNKEALNKEYYLMRLSELLVCISLINEFLINNQSDFYPDVELHFIN